MIEDLPEIQDLCETELQEIYGAGRPLRRRSRESFPGIVHLELLERREVFSATALQPLVQAPTADSVAVEMQGSRVERDAAGNTIFTQTTNGSVAAKAVFSAAGQIISYERAQGDLWVTANFQNGKLSNVTASKAGVSVTQQEFAAEGSVTKETQFDANGRKALETTITSSTRQVTVYVNGNTARVQTFNMNSTLKREVMIYEETWSGGKRISQTWNAETGELKSSWATNGDHRSEITVANGIRDERTFFKGVHVLHEQYSDLKDLSKALANQMAQEKKAGHIIVNPGQAELAITAIAAKPVLRETWGNDGKLIKTESSSYQTFTVPLNVPGVHLYNMILASRQTVTTYSGNRVISEVFSGGALVERSLTEKGVKLEMETWNSSGDRLTRTIYGANWTESYEYKTVTTGSGKSRLKTTFISMSSYRKGGLLERQEWFDVNGITARRFYKSENGRVRCILEETFQGTKHSATDLSVPNQWVISVSVSGKPTLNQTIKDGEIVEETTFHPNGKVKSYFLRNDAKTQATTLYNEKGEKTELQIFQHGVLQSSQSYVVVAGKVQPARFTVFDANGKRIQQTSWEYRSNGDVFKRARDFQQDGTRNRSRVGNWSFGEMKNLRHHVDVAGYPGRCDCSSDA